MKSKLTISQQIILDCIKKYCETNYEPPTLLELCEMAGLKTKSTVQVHLRNLQKKGYLEIEPRIKRGIKILKLGLRKD